MTALRAIFVGTSAGGISALKEILSELPAKPLPVPMVIVQHLPADAEVNPPLAFGSFTSSRIFEAVDKIPLEPGSIVFAPPRYHVLAEKNDCLSLSQDPPVHFSRPSIDVLFESAAAAYGPAACGILLTGANADGAAGLRDIHESGGHTIVQNPATAEASAMPAAALSLFRPSFTGSLKEISDHLKHLFMEPNG